MLHLGTADSVTQQQHTTDHRWSPEVESKLSRNEASGVHPMLLTGGLYALQSEQQAEGVFSVRAIKSAVAIRRSRGRGAGVVCLARVTCARARADIRSSYTNPRQNMHFAEHERGFCTGGGFHWTLKIACSCCKITFLTQNSRKIYIARCRIVQ